MKIKGLHIAGFGKWVGQSFQTDEDALLFFGDNEAGKSTLLAFIICMFYGLSTYRGADLSRNDRVKYKPWVGDFGGSLIFEQNGLTYRIDRRFGETKRGDTTVVTDVVLGKQLPMGDKEPGEYFFQLSREEMLHTAVMQQVATPMEGAQDIQRRWMNSDENEAASLVEIKQALEDYSKRVDGKGLRKPNQGTQLRDEIASIERQLLDATEQADSYRQKKEALLRLEQDGEALKDAYQSARDAWMQARPVETDVEAEAAVVKLKIEQQELWALPLPRIPEGKRHDVTDALNETKRVLHTLQNQKSQETLREWIEAGEDLEPKQSLSWLIPVVLAIGISGLLYSQGQWVWMLLTLILGVILAVALWKKQSPKEAQLLAWLEETGRAQSSTDEQRMRRLGELGHQLEAVQALERQKEQLLARLGNMMGTRYFENHTTIEDIQEVLYHDQTLQDVQQEMDKYLSQVHDNTNRVSQEAYERLRQAMRMAEGAWEEHKQHVVEAEVQLRHLERQLVPPATIESQLKKKKKSLEEVLEEQQAIELAMQIVDEATVLMAKDRGPQVQQFAQQYLERLTDEEYQVDVDQQLQVHLRKPGDFARQRAYYSAGKQDQIDLALRFAVMDGIYGQQQCPLLLDDVTERADEQRKQKILTFLMEKAKSDGRQLFYFSCHNSVREFFERTGVKIYNIH